MLVLTVLDIFVAGTETSGNIISYFLLYISLNPQTQRKLQKEIDEVIPKGLPPSINYLKR